MACVVVVCIAVFATASIGFILGRWYIFKQQARNRHLSQIQVHVCNIMGKDGEAVVKPMMMIRVHACLVYCTTLSVDLCDSKLQAMKEIGTTAWELKPRRLA